MEHQIKHLKRRDKKLAKVIERIELKPLVKTDDHFKHLIESIISQQISLAAAETITKRFVDLFPDKTFPEPKDILKISDAKMRSAGISNQKASYIKNIALAELNFEQIAQMSDEDVITELTKIKGIGLWTAEMFLMFSLHREDVFSYKDLGLSRAMKKVYGLETYPTPEKAKQISDKWKPYRTLGSRYLWASLE